MKKFILSLITVTFLASGLMLAAAEGAKAAKKADRERSVKGLAVCTKCLLKETTACGVAIQVTRKGKDGAETKQTIYLADNDVAKALQHKVCSAGQAVVAKGVLKKEGSKMLLTATKIETVQPKAKKAKTKA